MFIVYPCTFFQLFHQHKESTNGYHFCLIMGPILAYQLPVNPCYDMPRTVSCGECGLAKFDVYFVVWHFLFDVKIRVSNMQKFIHV